jgi:acyl-CoA thioester hydrolase
MQYLAAKGYTEMNLAGCGLIMSDAGIEFKAELFYGDEVTVSVKAAGFSKVAFDLYYKMEKQAAGKTVLVCLAKTGMVCYDYNAKKIAAVPAAAIEKLSE